MWLEYIYMLVIACFGITSTDRHLRHIERHYICWYDLMEAPPL